MHQLYYLASLVPRPLPVFQCYTLKNGKAWDATSQHIYTSRNNDRGRNRAGVEQVWPHFRILYDATHVRMTTVPRVLFQQDRDRLTLVLQVRSKTISMLKTSLRGDVQ